MSKKRAGTMAEILRRAFRESDMSMKRLADESGTQYASVHGFFATQSRDAKLCTVERWCKVLRIQLVPDKRKRG